MAVMIKKVRVANPAPARRTATAKSGGKTKTGSVTMNLGQRNPSPNGTVRRRGTSPSRIRSTRPNPAHIFTLGLLGANPAKKTAIRATKEKQMKKKTSRARSTAKKTTSTRRTARKSNPSVVVIRETSGKPKSRRRTTAKRNSTDSRKATTRRTTRRRNASTVYGSKILSPVGIKMIGGGLAGVALTKVVGRFIPANLRIGGFIGDTLIAGLTSVGLGMAASRFLGAEVGNAVTFGGLMYTGSVFLNGVAPNLRVMDTPLALGAWAPANFVVPQNPITDGMQAQMALPAPAPGANLAGLQRAFGNAF